jgi:DNA-damage-inducible protein D
MNDLQKYSDQTFENIKHINDGGVEFWYARELQSVLEYTQWRNFESVIDKAKIACINSGNDVDDHFADVSKTIQMPKTAEKLISDYQLSRYACYLIVQNGDPRKEVIALGQTYFAVKTRQQEQKKLNGKQEPDK